MPDGCRKPTAEGYKTLVDVAERGNIRTFTRLFGASFGMMLYQTITGKDQGGVLEEISEDYKTKPGVTAMGIPFRKVLLTLNGLKGITPLPSSRSATG